MNSLPIRARHFASFGLLALFSTAAFAQYCPGGTTYFATIPWMPPGYTCSLASCWSPNPFTGSTAVTGSQYPSTNWACATTTPPAGALENTQYNYDANGNLVTVTDPLAHVTTNTYDALNRLTRVVDPASGQTAYAYNGNGALVQVTDPRSLNTVYTIDGFGQTTLLNSPDTGITSYSSYDAAGNLLAKTDARGITVTYTYDNLGRVTLESYTDGSTRSYTYDTCTYGVGRLCSAGDAASTSSFTYEAHGRIASKTQQTGTLLRSIGYGYNGAGQLSQVTTPSGQQIGYAYSNNRVVAVSVNGQALVGSVGTEPFGPIAGWIWGNGLKMYRDFDADGRLATWEFRNGVSLLRRDQGFDSAGRITAINDPNAPTNNQTYQYDALDRLTTAQAGSPVASTLQFAYDAVGNRTTLTSGSAAMTLAYGAGSNQLQSATGALVATYPQSSAALTTLTYNNANRLIGVTADAVSATYIVNALGQRVSKTVGGVTTNFAYDESGHLMGEYDATGTLIQETVWLEGMPIATLRPTGATGNPTPINVYYVHADHLGSPRAITRPSDNAFMWRWDNADPFGNNAANENPAGQGSFNYALRFPGQYFDAETQTHYNYFRDYDPAIGRYRESDPVGLKGGANTFAYVLSNPVRWTDPRGLILYACTRSAFGPPENAAGNHSYLYWLETGDSCGMEQSSGSGGNPGGRERGPGGEHGDSCVPISGSVGHEQQILTCCFEANKKQAWIPFVNDCYTVANSCVDQYVPGPNPRPPGGRIRTECNSCWKPQSKPFNDQTGG